jgi:hypothetical protein
MFTPFTGRSKERTINLGNASSTSSSTVLARARAERQARERVRLEQQAALKIQKAWRGRRGAAEVADELLRQVERSADVESIGQAAWRGRALLVACWNGVGRDVAGRRIQALARWAAQVTKAPEGEQIES